MSKHGFNPDFYLTFSVVNHQLQVKTYLNCAVLEEIQQTEMYKTFCYLAPNDPKITEDVVTWEMNIALIPYFINMYDYCPYVSWDDKSYKFGKKFHNEKYEMLDAV